MLSLRQEQRSIAIGTWHDCVLLLMLREILLCNTLAPVCVRIRQALNTARTTPPASQHADYTSGGACARHSRFYNPESWRHTMHWYGGAHRVSPSTLVVDRHAM